MKLFDWLCGCDSPHRDETAQYITSDCKKPVICSEPAKSQTNGYPVVQYSKQSNGVSHQNGHLTTAPHREDFSVPEFNLIETDVRGYRRLVAEVRAILTDRQNRLESLLERQQLPDEVDGDVRLARGKIIVIVKNNLSTFDKLLKDANDGPQSIADLTGFWSLVHKELLDVQQACARVEESRLNNWRPVPRPATPPFSTPKSSARTHKANGQQTPGRNPQSNPNLKAFLDQKRKERREQLA